MGKYDGINIAEVTLINNSGAGNIRKSKAAWSTAAVVVVQIALAALVGLAAFLSRFVDTPVSASVSGFVQKAILYDMSFVGSDEPGAGVLVSFFDPSGGQKA